MTRRQWTRSEMRTLRRDYGRIPASVIARRTGRTVDAIRRRAFEWGLQMPLDRRGKLMRAARAER